MKRNLFAMLLAVVMIAAVIFVAAPATKADAAVTTISAADNATIKIENDGEYVIDIFGVKDVTVDVTAGNAKISFVDTKFMTGNWDLTGKSAGSVTVTGYTVPAYCQYGDYKYLAVPGENGTYSFHPFNLTITRYGVNVKQNGICVQASYIADGVVKELIEDYGLTNVTAEESASGKTQFPIPNGKYGVHAYYVLTGSLSAEKVNQTRELKAYINFKGYERIESNQDADVTPKTVLGKVNSEYPNYEGHNKDLADKLYANNPATREHLSNLKPATKDHSYTFANYPAGTQYAKNEKHVLDDILTATINDGHFTSELRLYDSANNDSTVIFYSPKTINTITLNAGEKAATLHIYTSEDGETWELAQSIATTAAYANHTIAIKNTHYIKLDAAGAQIRVKSLTITFIQPPHDCVFSDATCIKKSTCTICGDTTGDFAKHNYKEETIDATCGEAGYTSHTCTVCSHSYNDAEVPATGNHSYQNGVCTVCGNIEGVTVKPETLFADFSTVAPNTSYSSRVTTTGWKGTNCAVVAIDGTRGFTMNGKTSAKGSIVSPTLANGLSKLTLEYTNTNSESNGVDITITIKQNGIVKATKRIDNNSVTQNTHYAVEWDLAAEGIALSGDFSIEITNNSPSNNSSKNKDRVTIWNLSWTTNP